MAANPGAITDVEAADFPCSAEQERFWLLDSLQPGDPSLNVAVRWQLEGRVSVALLQRAWETIIERHEILRTVFVESAGKPLQRVLARSRFRLTEIDLQHLPEDQRSVEGDRIGLIEARAPFDLRDGPLLRVVLLRFSPSVCILVVTTHQIVSDGWSIGVMAREMGIIYDALGHDEPVPLEELPIQYADFSQWQIEWLRERGTDAETAYWTRQLAGVKPFAVAADKDRPDVRTTNGQIASLVLPRALTDRLQALCADRAVTLFAGALAGLCAMLARYTGNGEVVLGTQVSGRDQVELEGMIGQFVNSLILRNQLGDDPSFEALVSRVADVTAQALEHRNIPIERLLAMVKAERQSTKSTAISVNFIFQKTFIQNTSYRDFRLIDMPSLPAGAIYDLNFFMVERPDGWRFSCQYNTDQFEAQTANRLLRYVQELVRHAAANPGARISELPFGDAGELNQLLDRLNDTHSEYPRDATIPGQFDAQAARTPDAIALQCGNEGLSFGEARSGSDRLAAYLREQGIGRGTRVGLLLHRSPDLLIAPLAVMKSGASCVPLDPADSAARLATLAQISGITAVVVASRKSGIGLSPDIRVLAIDEAGQGPAEGTAATVAAAAPSAEGEAWLVFTAAGAASPAPVALSHRALVNCIHGVCERLGVGASDGLLTVSPPTFDSWPVELLLGSASGASVIVMAPEDLANGRQFTQLLRRTSASLMYGSAATWQTLLESGWRGEPALKVLCPQAELRRALVDQLLACGCELWAMYGHPQAGVWSAARLLVSGEDRRASLLGRPLANTSMRILEPSRQAAPVGVRGTLYIVSESIPDGWDSGDFARLRADGRVELLGRADRRFWRAGCRVDPEEIEATLRAEPGVQDAAVFCRQAGGRQALLAFVAAGAVSPEGILERLRTTLPAHLLPDSIQVRESLERLPDGSVDVGQLLARGVGAEISAGGPPQGDTELRIAALWQAMLGMTQIDRAANFFELGGHSLLAARMLARLGADFGRRITLATLFQAPTIAKLAAVLDQPESRSFDFRQVVKLQPNGSMPPLIAVNNTGVYYLLTRYLGPEQPLISLQLFDPSVKSDNIPRTLEEVAAGYVQLINRVHPSGPFALIGWCAAGALTFEIARQMHAAQRPVIDVFMMDSWVPRYFQRLPALRRILGNYSLRWQLIVADWHKTVASGRSKAHFFRNRNTFKYLMGRVATLEAETDETVENAELYDRWLLQYLQQLTNQYEPKPYAGRVTLFRSREEPTGWFFEPSGGWRQFVTGQLDLHIISGNHFTMFQDPGAGEMAARMTEILTAVDAGRP